MVLFPCVLYASFNGMVPEVRVFRVFLLYYLMTKKSQHLLSLYNYNSTTRIFKVYSVVVDTIKTRDSIIFPTSRLVLNGGIGF